MGARNVSPRAPLPLLELELPAALVHGDGRVPLRVRLGARLGRHWLDRRLMRGCDPAGSPYLALRAADLTRRRNRNELARALCRCREAGSRGREPLSSRIPVDAAEIAAAAPLIGELEELLRSRAPVYCRGIVLGWRLIGDGGGPFYAPQRRGELGERLEAVLASLRGAP